MGDFADLFEAFAEENDADGFEDQDGNLRVWPRTQSRLPDRGSARLDGKLSGRLDRLAMQAAGEARDLRWKSKRIESLRFALSRKPDGALEYDLRAKRFQNGEAESPWDAEELFVAGTGGNRIWRPRLDARLRNGLAVNFEGEARQDRSAAWIARWERLAFSLLMNRVNVWSARRIQDRVAAEVAPPADRARLAQELDNSEARGERLQEANREVSRRLVTAMETIRAVLDR